MPPRQKKAAREANPIQQNAAAIQQASTALAAAAAAAGPVAPAARVIDVDNFIRVRDSVYDRLSTIQDLIKSFAVDYLRQTNLLLGEPTHFTDAGPQPLQALEQHLGDLGPQLAAADPVVGEKKGGKKKRVHDFNAPKRPLTPYFLYMQTARPIIANDLGDDAPKRGVQEEGQRRWGSMNAAEKQGWNQAYQYNLRLYNARVHSYKNGNPSARDMDDDEANAYANGQNIPLPGVAGLEDVIADDEGAIADQLQANVAEKASSEEPEKPKTPKAKQPRKRKAPTPVVEDAPPTPEKKRKRTSTRPAETEVVEPKKSTRRKSNKAA